MKYIFDGYNWFMRLDKGERLGEAFEKFFAETGCEGGWVSGIGGAQEVTLGYFDLEKKDYEWRIFALDGGPYELTSLQGSIALSESSKPMFHLHGTISGPDYRTHGGHIKDLVVAATLELFIHRSQQSLNRKTDPGLGIQTLSL